MATDSTPKELYQKSKELYDNIRKKGKNGQSSKWAYYYCKCILNKKKNVKGVTQADAKNVTGQSVNITLTKKEHTDKMKKYCKWAEDHQSLPNYVIIKDKKVNPKIWNAYVGYLFKVYYETGKLPASRPIKSNIYNTSSSGTSLHNYLTNKGCSGMGQCTGYYCACNSLQQSFYRLTGIKVDEKTIAGWAGTTSDGTDHAGINTAVAKFNKKYNKNIKINWYNFSELSWTKISKFIKKGAVFFHLLYRNKWGHYEPIQSVGDPLKILNSLGNSCGSGTYCGYIENRTKSEQKRYINGISQKSVAVLTNGGSK